VPKSSVISIADIQWNKMVGQGSFSAMLFKVNRWIETKAQCTVN